jgi:putative transcriptional regulator
MSKPAFTRLLNAVKEMKAIQSGKLLPAKVSTLKPDGKGGYTRTVTTPRKDAELAKRVRLQLGMSQSEFSKFLSVPLNTIQNWEQGARAPTGAALTLLKVAEKNPQAVLDAVA